MNNYTLHLGFNWNSPLIGAIWGRGQVSAEYRALQYALANDSNSGAPAWFQFQVDDVLSVLIWDLGSSPASKGLTLKMSFSQLEEVATYNPSNLIATSDATALRDGATEEWYLSFDAIVSSSIASGTQGPWGPSTYVYSAGSFRFIKESTFKLSYSLRAANPGNATSKVFLADPEVIVGSRGG